MADAKNQFDLIVVGSGPGGYATAIRASQLGMKTAIVERAELGGICLNWGCIPTKALLRTSEVFHMMENAEKYGLGKVKPVAHIEKIVERSRGVSKQMANGVAFLMKKNKITVIEGTASLKAGKPAPSVVVTDGKGAGTYTAKHIIMATGARARSIPQAGLVPDGDRIWSYREALVPKEVPKKLLVIGSGAIGIEFASFYNTLGSETTVIEALDRILPVEDADISNFVDKQLTKQGMKLIKSAQVQGLEKSKNSVTASVKLKDGSIEKITADIVIVAVGIVGNVENTGLEEVGAKVDRTHVVVDGFGRTGVPGLYAIGDLTGPPWLAHKATHEGIVCVEKIAGQNPHEFKTNNIAGCTYCHPQVASVGLTEAAAKEKGHKVKVGRFPFMGNGKAVALGEPEGIIKTIFDEKTGELLGAHMAGAEVTELIQGFVIARQAELTEAEIMETIFPHPTLSEMMHESTLDAYDRALHI